MVGEYQILVQFRRVIVTISSWKTLRSLYKLAFTLKRRIRALPPSACVCVCRSCRRSKTGLVRSATNIELQKGLENEAFPNNSVQ